MPWFPLTGSGWMSCHLLSVMRSLGILSAPARLAVFAAEEFPADLLAMLVLGAQEQFEAAPAVCFAAEPRTEPMAAGFALYPAQKPTPPPKPFRPERMRYEPS